MENKVAKREVSQKKQKLDCVIPEDNSPHRRDWKFQGRGGEGF